MSYLLSPCIFWCLWLVKWCCCHCCHRDCNQVLHIHLLWLDKGPVCHLHLCLPLVVHHLSHAVLFCLLDCLWENLVKRRQMEKALTHIHWPKNLWQDQLQMPCLHSDIYMQRKLGCAMTKSNEDEKVIQNVSVKDLLHSQSDSKNISLALFFSCCSYPGRERQKRSWRFWLMNSVNNSSSIFASPYYLNIW